MRPALFLFIACAAYGQDAREIVRKSVELDQANWMTMKNYTWTATDTERHLDSGGNIKSEDRSRWETVILYGEPFRHMLERHGKPLTPDEQRKDKEKLDKKAAELARETPEQSARRLAKLDKERAKEREFLREIPDAFDLRILRDDKVDGHDVWVIAGTPKPGYKPRRSDAKPLLKIKGEVWIDKAEYQWVKLTAETIDTISFGGFIARLNPGATLLFEQTRVNDQVWLPKRAIVRGAGRIALLKKLAMEEEITWSNFRKFQADSRIVARTLNLPRRDSSRRMAETAH